MNKSRSVLRPDRRDGRVRAVVLRPAAVPVAGLRRPRPAQAEGLPLHDVVRGGDASSPTEADVRISGVPVGKVKTIEPDKETGRSDVVIELQSRYAPLPSDARAILRQKTLLGETYVELTPGTPDAAPVPEDGALAEARSSGPSSSTRSSARSTPDARGVPDLDAGAGAGDRRLRARPQRRARQPRAVRRGRRARSSTCSTARRAPSRSSCPTRATCSTRSPSATASCAG